MLLSIYELIDNQLSQGHTFLMILSLFTHTHNSHSYGILKVKNALAQSVQYITEETICNFFQIVILLVVEGGK